MSRPMQRALCRYATSVAVWGHSRAFLYGSGRDVIRLQPEPDFPYRNSVTAETNTSTPGIRFKGASIDIVWEVPLSPTTIDVASCWAELKLALALTGLAGH